MYKICIKVHAYNIKIYDIYIIINGIPETGISDGNYRSSKVNLIRKIFKEPRIRVTERQIYVLKLIILKCATYINMYTQNIY